MRRRTLLVVLVGLAVVVAVGVVVLWPRQDRISRQNLERIKRGMTRAEVEAILGPPGDHATAPLEDPDPHWLVMSNWRPYDRPVVDRFYRVSVEYQVIQWRGDAGIICVEFTLSDHVVEAGMYPVKRVEQTLLGNLLWRAKRQWHRWFP
jgi:hypothetical protein